MYGDIPPALLRLIEPVVGDHGLEVVDASVREGRGRARVVVVVDTPEGDGRVTLDRCAAVSREISHGLDAADFMSAPYVLEVTSPGVDRALGRMIDFERVVGREVRVETRELLGGRRHFRGRLAEFAGGCVRVETDAGDFRIPFHEIQKAHAFYAFEPAGGTKR